MTAQAVGREPGEASLDIGVLLLATDEYWRFVPPLVAALRTHFLVDHDVTLFVFTDHQHELADAVVLPIEHGPWPQVTLERFHVFNRYRERFDGMDYLFYLDVDMLPVGAIGPEILPPPPKELVAVRHPGFYEPGVRGTYENRPVSTAFVGEGEGTEYFAGALFGGTSAAFLEMSERLAANIERDRELGLTAVWHDESHLNRYLIDHPPHALSPAYCYPERWDLPFEPIVIALDKNDDPQRPVTRVRSEMGDNSAEQVRRLEEIQDRIRGAGGADDEMLGRLSDLAARVEGGYVEPPIEEPEPTPAGPPRQLTIGMACHGDFDGVFFSVYALRLYHPEVTDRTEIMVLDNAPWKPEAWAFKHFEGQVENYRYVPAGDLAGTAIRDRIFRESNSEWVMVIDSHVLLEPGSLARLLDYMDAHEDSTDLLQGPMLGDDIKSVTTQMDPKWNDGMFGVWGNDERGADPDADPFPIPMQGLGVFACRREAWPGFNPRFRGFGGEEGYLHEKFRRRGDETLCLPFLRWLHRFQRPGGPPYQVSWEDRIRNYMIGFEEVGLDSDAVVDHFGELLGASNLEPIIERVHAELANPFSFFDAIFCINLDVDPNRWRQMEERFERLGIANRVERFSAIETPDLHHVGCTLSHRKVVELAAKRGLDNVLVFEDDATFHEDSLEILTRSIEGLRHQPDWKLLYLGGVENDGPSEPVSGHQGLAHGGELTQTHAIAYNRPFFDELLEAIPPTPAEVRAWIESARPAIDQWLAFDVSEEKFLTAPQVSVQEVTLHYLAPEDAGHYS